MNAKEELTKLIMESYARGVEDAKQEALVVFEKFRHNEEVLMNALWKACGDDAQVVEATIESQGELK
jgi:hypothetical protein